jgi:hypothetical protein
MKSFNYYRLSADSANTLITALEAATDTRIANFGDSSPDVINGFLEKDTDGIVVTLYEESDAGLELATSAIITPLDLTAAEATLDSFFISRGYTKL